MATSRSDGQGTRFVATEVIAKNTVVWAGGYSIGVSTKDAEIGAYAFAAMANGSEYSFKIGALTGTLSLGKIVYVNVASLTAQTVPTTALSLTQTDEYLPLFRVSSAEYVDSDGDAAIDGLLIVGDNV